MSNKEITHQVAYESMLQGYHSSEAVLRGMEKFLGIKMSLTRIGTGFGGGIGGTGLVCGAISAGVIIIGIKYGRDDLKDESDQITWSLIQDFIQQFKEKWGGVSCYELTNCNLTTPKGIKQYIKLGIDKKCQKIVDYVISTLITIITNFEGDQN